MAKIMTLVDMSETASVLRTTSLSKFLISKEARISMLKLIFFDFEKYE